MQDTQKSTLDQFRDRNENGSHSVYQDYKQTDHELFRKIPQGWDIFKLKQISGVFPSNVDKKERDKESTIRLCNYTEVYNNSEITSDLDFMEATAKSSEIQKFRLEEGDVIITKDSESWDDIGVPAYIEETMDGVICGYHLTHLKPNESLINGKYLNYFLTSDIGSYHFHIESNGVTRYGISTTGIKEAPVTLPPKKEQEAIVKFLDRETENVDSLIRRKEKLIKLLEEKRTAIINDLTVSGINNSKKEDVDIEWLDSIPKDWESTSLRNTVDKFVDYRGATPDKSDSGITLITAKNIENGRLDFSEDHEYVTKEVYDDWMTRGKPEEGDVLITTEAPMGEVAQVQETPVALAQRIILLKVNTGLIKKDFLKYFLNSEFNQTQLIKSQTGSTAKGIQASKLKGIRVLIPPLSEQEKIIEKIEQESKKIGELISEVEEGIERLKEYRTALITEAVTGQIDVRGEV
jgi:type I restriction enzyme S subunit